jgi:F0F1-type ATP synthase membrane subunit c/vacuolar-type H+-ATPase subunit K
MTAEEINLVLVGLAGVLVALTGLITAVGILIVRVETARRAVDGRMDQLISTARIAGHAEGVVLGAALEHAATSDEETC